MSELKRARRFSVEQVAAAVGRSADDVMRDLQAAGAEQDDEEPEDDKWVDLDSRQRSTQDKVAEVGSRTDYLLKVTREIGKDVHKNSIRLEAKGVKVKDFHINLRQLTVELNRNPNVIMIRAGPYHADIIHKDFGAPKQVIEKLKATLAKLDCGSKFMIMPPYDPCCNPIKAASRFVFKQIGSLMRAYHPGEAEQLGPAFRMKTQYPVPESPNPQFSIELTETGTVIVNAAFSMKDMSCVMTIMHTLRVGGTVVPGTEIQKVLSGGWGGCDFRLKARVLAEREEVERAPNFREVKERLRADR